MDYKICNEKCSTNVLDGIKLLKNSESKSSIINPNFKIVPKAELSPAIFELL